MSLFNSATYSDDEAATPALTAAANPRLAGSATSETSGQRSLTCAVVPSVLPLSTTIASAGRLWPAREASAPSSNSRPFHVGMTTATRLTVAATHA